MEKCPECGSTCIIRDYDSGEAVCGDCGLVVEERFLDEDPETRARQGNSQRKVHSVHGCSFALRCVPHNRRREVAAHDRRGKPNWEKAGAR